jgi:hypothetical protein
MVNIKIKEINLLDTIFNIVCNYYRVSKQDVLLSPPKANPHYIFIKYMTVYLYSINKNKGVSLSKLANDLNMTNHTVVIYGVKQITNQRETYTSVDYDVAHLDYVIKTTLRIAKLEQSYILAVKIHKSIKTKTNGISIKSKKRKKSIKVKSY